MSGQPLSRRDGQPRSQTGGRPRVYTIAAHRGFADALVAGLLSRYGSGDFGLARVTLLLPNRRAERIVTEAFIRSAGALEAVGEAGIPAPRGLLLPRMAVVGDLDLEEALGPLLDPLPGDDDADIPTAVDLSTRWMTLAALIARIEGDAAPKGAALLRRARETARIIDRLAVEGIAPRTLISDEVAAILGDCAAHWQNATRGFLTLHAYWQAELAARGAVDPPTRRNMLFDRLAPTWRRSPPPHAVVAAGITSASPALARLLRVVSEMPQGAVVLPDLDIGMADDVWAALGLAGQPEEPGGPPFGREDAVTHPQYHLKLLLGRMGVARGEVRPWHRSGISAAPPARSAAISSLFLPPQASAGWVDLPEAKRRLAGVRLMESAHPGEEAQAIALMMREALETPERRVALVTPDRGLAGRVVAHLRRWDIMADDTAGQPLSQTPAGRFALLLAEVLGEGAPPVPLVALLGHPLVRGGAPWAGVDRARWLEQVRGFDVGMRGPRPAAGLFATAERVAAIAAKSTEHGRPREAEVMLDWWSEVSAALAPFMALADLAEAPPLTDIPLADLLRGLSTAGEALCGEGLWARADGRALAALIDDIALAAADAATRISPRDLAPALRDAMDLVAVRPPWGGHPRVAIYGLLEARMARADVVICGGLVEGVWPAAAAPDPLLPPAVLRHLGVPSGEFRIGLAAHDLAAALGAPQVVLSWARRDESGPVIPSRFVLRVKAMLGGTLAARHREKAHVDWAQAIDLGTKVPAHPRPQPMPSPEQRRVRISATGLDRLRGDPYQFYAASILGLRRLDPLDAVPSPAWRGQAAHDILDAWHKSGAIPGTLAETAGAVLDTMSAHPLARALWRPRLLAALAWVDAEDTLLRSEGRRVLATECTGMILRHGIRIHARADRIDRLADGNLAIVDYKTGAPPSARQVAEGFALQLGLIGLIAREGGFADVAGEPTVFEYWSFAKKAGQIGYRMEPIPEGRRTAGIPREIFIDRTADYLDEALARWILGNEPFTARLNPDLGGYNDFDQLMRLDEWIASVGRETSVAAAANDA